MIPAAPRTTAGAPGRGAAVPRSPLRGAAVLAAYLLLSALLTIGAWRDPGGRLVGTAQDAIQHVWFLSWLPFALAHGRDPLLTRYLDHPGPVNLMWNNATPLLALLAAPLTVTLGAVVAYAALLTGAVVASAFSAYLLAARLVRHRMAAVVAGLAYGFSPYVVAQATGAHLPLVTICGPPLLALCVHELVARRRARPGRVGLAAGVVLAAQLLTSEELLLTEALMGLLLCAWLALTHPGAVRRGAGRCLGAAPVAVVTFAVLAALPLLVQLDGPARLGQGPVQPSGRYVADLLGLVVPTAVLHFAPAGAVHLTTRFTANLSEWDAYLGVPLLALALAAPLILRRGWAWAAAAVGAAALVLALGPVLHVGGRPVGVPLPWSWLGRLPGYRDVLPDRLTVYAFLAAALLLAGLCDRCRHLPARRWGWAASLGLAAAALLPLLPRGPLVSEAARVPAFFRTAAVHRWAPGRVVEVVPVAWGPDDQAMLWQAASGMRFALPTGYILHPGPHGAAIADPPGSPLSSVLRAAQAGDPTRLPPLALRRLRRQLAGLRAEAVVVGPMRGRAAAAALVTRLLGRPPLSRGGVLVWMPAGEPPARPAG